MKKVRQTKFKGDTPTAGSLGINQSLDEMMRTGTSGKEVSEKETEEDDVELDLEGIDDDEIDMMILKPAEVKRFFSTQKIKKYRAREKK